MFITSRDSSDSTARVSRSTSARRTYIPCICRRRNSFVWALNSLSSSVAVNAGGSAAAAITASSCTAFTPDMTALCRFACVAFPRA